MTVSNISKPLHMSVVTKVHVEPPLAEGTKDCLNGPGHMTHVAIMPIWENL